MNRVRLLALARKTIDESSTEPERVTSGNILAREMIRLLENETVGRFFDSNDAVDEILKKAKEGVERAVATAVQRASAPVDPESPPTWVEFDPPPKAESPFDANAFGKKPSRRR